MQSPITIIFELLVGLINRGVESLSFAFVKLVELFVSLSALAGVGAFGFLIAVVIGSIVLLFVLKFIFRASKMLIILVLALIVLLLIILLAVSLTAPVAPTNSTISK